MMGKGRGKEEEEQGGLWPFNRYVWLVNQLRYADIVNIMEVNI